MTKYITLALSLALGLAGCHDGGKDDTGNIDGSDTSGLPEGTECNKSGNCIYECSGEECKAGVDLDGGVMSSVACCHYDSGDNLVCEPVGWYERQSDGAIVADCDDDICRLTFSI